MTEEAQPPERSDDPQVDARAEAPPCSLHVEYDRCVNFALHQNDVPTVKLVRLTNESDADVSDVVLRIWIDHDLSSVVERAKTSVRAGETWSLDAMSLPMNAAALSSQQEREVAQMHVEVSWDGQVRHRAIHPVDVLAYNEWSGLVALPEILAAFITPNQPAVERILRRASDILSAKTGDGSLAGYQQGGDLRVAAITRACYLAASELGIGYINPPASFEERGQKIRFPQQIEEMRLGTCLDLTLLMAACLEQSGLHPIVFLIHGHAFVGVWTADTCLSEAITDDAARMRKHIRLGDIVAFEATALTKDKRIPFESACEDALRHLDDSESFTCALDVRAARKLRIRPIALRDGSTTPSAIPSDDASEEAPWRAQSTRSRSTPEDGEPGSGPRRDADESADSRIQRWKHKLLDLSLRNRLINFRESKQTVRILSHDLDALEDGLAQGSRFMIGPRPSLLDESAPRDLALHKERTREDALAEFLREDLEDKLLRTNLEEDELNSRLLKIYRQSRSTLEETGANTLFLGIGFLSWYESESSSQERRAPIVLLPLELTRTSVQAGFRLKAADDDPRINVTLLKKLERDFKVDTRGLDELPEGEAGLDIHEILQRFRHAVINLPRWDVRESAQIAMFSFSKFLMWQDLDQNADKLLVSPVVDHLVNRPGEPFVSGSDSWPQERELDDRFAPQDVYCPLDADSSQLKAIFAAQEGGTFVLQGPPGTGKSQTITNLIAHALGHGKRVLFVAEKMAALNVVHDRLTKVGLASACLEVHSNKANKLDVLRQLGDTLEHDRVGKPANWAERTARLEARRAGLNAYVRAIHQPNPCGLSYFQAASQLIGLADEPRFDLEIDGIEFATEASLARIRERIAEAEAAANSVGGVADHPLAALTVEEYRAGLPNDLEAQLDELQRASAELETALAAAASILGFSSEVAPHLDAQNSLELLSELSSVLPGSPGPAPELLAEPGFQELRPRLEQELDSGRARDQLHRHLTSRFASSFLDEDADAWLGQLDRAETSFFLFRWFRTRGVRRRLSLHAKSTLPPNATLRKSLEELKQLRALQQRLSSATNPAAMAFGARWTHGTADWHALGEQLDWVQRLRGLLVRLQSIELPTDVALRARDAIIALATRGRDTITPDTPNRRKLEHFVRAHGRLLAGLESARARIGLDESAAFGPAHQPGRLLRIQAWIRRSHDHRHELRNWCHWRRTRGALVEHGLGTLVEATETGRLQSDSLRRGFDRYFLEKIVHHLTNSIEAILHFNSREHERRIDEFRDLDRDVMRLSQQVVESELSSRTPRRHDGASGKSEMGILARQLKLKRRHMPIRRLFESLPTLLPQLKPCLLMSPLSVAQYLSPNVPPADLVIFDEASQIPVWDAIGALARGKHAIIVGDSKQLPPTSFFSRSDDEEEEESDTVQDLESILDECDVGGLPTLHLKWHYRSRHESLITFSNHHYYENELLTFPSSVAEPGRGMGVSLRHFADGIYDRGKSATNRVEAQAIRDEIVDRLRRHASSGQGDAPSIGVVAFSKVQQTLIEDLVDEARREHPEIEGYFDSSSAEPVFIKNLENVQGDERDTIMFSICYGRDAAGKIAMAFGPINRTGGQRRLNVAITRARRELVVFSSIRSDDIDLRRTQALGAKHLRAFLDYAERGPRALAEAIQLDAHADFESPFEKQVHDMLVAKGHEVDIQVGCSGYRIDMAVRHPTQPGRYVLGIECDGAAYHSAATARDRDRIREAVLRGLGWQLHRIWSTDWWENRAHEVERLEAAIQYALSQEAPAEEQRATTESTPDVALCHRSTVEESREHFDTPTPSESPEPTDVSQRFANAISPEATRAPTSFAVTYPRRRATPTLGEPDRILDSDQAGSIERRMLEVLESEAPIRIDALFRRVAESYSVGRVGSRIRARLEAVLRAIRPNSPVVHGEFVWRSDQDPDSWRLFRVPAEDDECRTADEIPPVEVANAAEHILRIQFGLPLEELERETARLLGFGRMGGKVRQSMTDGIRTLESRGGCDIQDGNVSLPR